MLTKDEIRKYMRRVQNVAILDEYEGLDDEQVKRLKHAWIKYNVDGCCNGGYTTAAEASLAEFFKDLLKESFLKRTSGD